MTNGALLSDLYRRLNYAAAPAAGVVLRLQGFLNEAMQDLISVPGLGEWITLNNPPITFASVASRAVYALPASLQRIDAITERTNDWKLEMRPFDWYRTIEPDPTNTGTPSVWVPIGFQPVTTQPAAATGIWAVSSAAGDTTQSVKLETIRTGGVPFSGALTLNGTTRVQLGTATDHESVTKFYVSAVAVGTISLFDAAAAGNLLGTIAIGQTFARYLAIALWPTPSGILTYTVDGERDLLDMSNPTDEPPIPPRFHRVLIDGVLYREYQKKDRAEDANTAKRQYSQGISQLRYFVTCPPDFLPSRQRTYGHSRFGSNYPDGNWRGYWW